MRVGATKQPEGTIAIDATASSLAKKERGFSIANSDRTCSNGGS